MNPSVGSTRGNVPSNSVSTVSLQNLDTVCALTTNAGVFNRTSPRPVGQSSRVIISRGAIKQKVSKIDVMGATLSNTFRSAWRLLFAEVEIFISSSVATPVLW